MRKLIVLSILFLVTLSFTFGQTYEEVAKEIGLGNHVSKDDREMCGGVVVFDYNNDGYEDIFAVGGFLNNSALFKNKGDGTFENVYSSSGISIPQTTVVVGCAAADLDNDGDIDLFITTNERADNYIYENRNGVFYDVTLGSGLEVKIWSTAVSFVDFDLDSDLDIYVSNYVGADGRCDANFFYENLGDFKFKEISKELGVDDSGCSLASTFSDYDNDGDPDLLVANDFGLTIESNKIFENQYPERKFIDVSDATGFNDRIFGMGIEGGDFDEDGDFDYYTTNIGENKFYVNDGNKNLVQQAEAYGMDDKFKKGTDSLSTSWGIHWYDYENDGDMDLFVSNGNVILTDSVMAFEVPNLLYQNDGSGNFTEVGELEGVADTKQGRGIALNDFDNDGDMDIVQVVVNSTLDSEADTDDDRIHFFKNNASENGNNWIQFKIVGTTDNRDAVGAKVFLYFDGRELVREVNSGGSSYMSQRTRIIHYGLGSANSINRVEVVFPNGEKVVKAGLAINQRHTITQTYRSTENVELCFGERYKNMFTAKADTTIQENYKASDGVDSIVTVYIDVIEEIIMNENMTVCYGQEVNGRTWKNDGSYEELFRSYKGCDSTIVYNITVEDPVESNIDTTVCYGGLFNGVRITKDRSLLMEHENPDGCDSIVVYDITVNEGPKYSEVFEVCMNSEYNGVNIDSDTTFFNSYKTEAGCDSIYEEKIVVLPYGIADSVVEIYSNEPFEGNFYENDTTLYKNLGVVAQNGCDSVLAIHINVTISGVEYDEYNAFKSNIYPNPVEDEIEISFLQQNPQKVTIELYSSSGQLVATLYNGYSNKGENVKSFNLEKYGISAGVYLIKIIDENKYRTMKFIKK